MNTDAANTETDRYVRGALLVIAFALLVRLLLAAWLPLIADEAYGVVVSRYPTLSYFDHPPLAFGFARAAAWLFGTESGFIVRLPHVLMGTLSGWLVFLITRRAFGSKAGFWAVGAYSVAPFFLASAGAFVVPDGPLNLFALLAFWLIQPTLLGGSILRSKRWVLAGVAFGLALLSKYTAFVFGASALTLLLISANGRRELARPGPWLTGIIALACLTPVIVWNAQNGWISFTFQSDRASTGGFNPLNFLAIQLGQAAYLLPWTWVLALAMVVRGLFASDARRTFAIMAAPTIFLFGLVGFATIEPLAHWAMPGFLFAFPLIGHWCATHFDSRSWVRRTVLAGSAVLTGTLALAVALQATNAGATRALGITADRDFDWTFLSWSALEDDFAERGILADPQAFIVATTWNIGGKSAYAVGPMLPAAAPLVIPRHFALSPDPRLTGRDHGYLVDATWPGGEDKSIAFMREHGAARFVETGEPWIVTQRRAGRTAFQIVVMPVAPR